MVRPHPAVWRIIHGMVILYMLALVFLLFQNAGDARLLLKVLQPTASELSCFLAPQQAEALRPHDLRLKLY